MAPTKTAKPARLPAKERREHFLDVAAQLVIEKGAESLTMEGVAAAAGTSKGLGYAYFENADALILALIEREMSNLDEALARAVRSTDSLEGQVRAMFSTYLSALKLRGILVVRLLQARKRGRSGKRLMIRRQRMEEFWAERLMQEYKITEEVAKVAIAMQLRAVNGAIDAWMRRVAPRQVIEDTFVASVMGSFEALRVVDR